MAHSGTERTKRWTIRQSKLDNNMMHKRLLIFELAHTERKRDLFNRAFVSFCLWLL